MPLIIIWRPHPVAVIEYPASMMIRCPTPRLIVHPCPPEWRHPTPASITVGRPVRVRSGRGRIRTPHVTVLLRVDPFAIVIKVFGAVDVAVVVLIVERILKTLRYHRVAVKRSRIKLI